MTDQHNDFANAQTIQQWGLTVEKHVDLALRAGKGAVKKLGRAYRGRCQPARFVKCPILAPTKVANHGSFEPSTEVLTDCRAEEKLPSCVGLNLSSVGLQG